MSKNKIITSEGNVQFIYGDDSGRVINVHPFHIYTSFYIDTVSFILIAMPKSSGLAIFTTKAEDLEVNGSTYTFSQLPDALAEAFAIAGAQARAEIVDELPESGMTNTIYLVPIVDPETGEINKYDEYIWIKEEERWELLGDTSIELDRYVTKETYSAYTASTQALIDTVSGDVETETAARISGDTYLEGLINAEVSARTDADTALETLINTVSGNVETETARAEGVEAALSGAIETVSGDVISESERAISAETALAEKIGDKVVELTQAEYDALVSGGTADPEVLYIITDATEVNMAEYYKKTETSGKTEIQSALDAKADKANAVASAVYVSSSTTIDLKNISGDVISQVDASDFIIDGMVDDVKIENGYLVITFNTDAGKQDIQIPLTDIFDPSNYYDKNDVDGFVGDLEAADSVISGAVDTVSSDLATEAQRAQDAEGALSDAVDTKLAISDFNTYSGNVETELSEKADSDDVYAKAEVYTKSEVDASQLAQDNKIDTVSGAIDTKLTNYYTKSETSGKTQISTALDAKQNTLSAGRAIDITSDVVSFTLPISAGTGENSVVEGSNTKAYGNNCHAEGRGSTAGKSGSNNGYSSHAEGEVTLAEGNMSHSEGNHTQANGVASHAEGSYTKANGAASHAEGSDTRAFNDNEHASGKFNVSTKYNTTFGSNGNTIFSVGNGIGDTKRHNTIEVKQNGDVYIADTSQITGTGSGETEGHNFYDVPMINLQDALESKQGSLTAGNGIDITSDVISCDLPISAGTGVGSLLMSGSGNTASGDYSVAYGKLNTVAGTCGLVNGNRNTSNNFAEAAFGQMNISRTEDASSFGHSGNTIYTIGNGVINASGESKNHNAFEVRGNGDIYIANTNATGSYYDKPMIKLQDHLGGGGSSYTAGDGIDITNDVISVTGKVDTSAFTAYSADVQSAITNAINAKADTTAVTQAISEATSGKADSSAVTESLATKVNVADNNVPAFSGVPLAINVNESYASLQLKTIYIKNNDTTQHTNVVLGSFNYYNGSYNASLIVSGSSRSSNSVSGITAITNTDTSYYTFTLENGVCRIDFLGSCYFSQITLEGDGFSFYYIHNNNYTSGQSSTVIENTVYDALTELGKDIVDMNDSGRFVNVSKAQDITGQKNFIGDKGIKFSQSTSSNKPGFVIYAVDTANTTTEAATFEFRPNTFTETISGTTIKHPLLYFGHYRTNTNANKGIPQTVVGFRQYDQPNSAAYHMLAPLPDKAKTPFSLTTTYQDFYIPMGFKNGSTMIKADETGVADLSSELGGLKLMKLTQSEYDALSPNYDSNTLYVIVN